MVLKRDRWHSYVGRVVKFGFPLKATCSLIVWLIINFLVVSDIIYLLSKEY